jgi:hypothetical protein
MITLSWWVWTIIIVLSNWASLRTYKWSQKWVEKKRDLKFLRAIQIDYPEATITTYSVASTEQEAIDKVKEQLDAIR